MDDLKLERRVVMACLVGNAFAQTAILAVAL